MVRPLTVMQVLPAMDSGGVERGTVEVSAGLLARGHRSLVVSEGGRLVRELHAHGAEHIDWPVGRKSPLTFRYVPWLRRLLIEQKVDVLDVRSRLPAWVAYLAWRGMDAAHRPHLVTSVHGLYSVNRYSAVMTRGERVVAVSETVRRYITENYPEVEAERIEVIPRGVDPEAFPRGYRPSPQWINDWYAAYPHLRNRLVLTLTGRITRVKGHEAFIELVARLRSRGLDVQGVIVGGTDPRKWRYARDLEAHAQAYGVDDCITFTGYRADVREIYAVSNLVYAISSKPESFGRTALEALTLGIPVVGYDRGGTGEVLRALFPEGLVGADDADALERRTLELLRQRPRVAPQTRFTLARMVGDTVDLYERLCEAAAPAEPDAATATQEIGER